MDRKVRICDYDRDWPRRYEYEAGKIQTALGSRALRVEHVGSTSVPGLSAKPVIDIVLVVADSAQEQEYTALLLHAGYELHIREPEWHEHRMFRDPEKRVNLHVFSTGCPEIGRMLAFRDWLRINEDDRELYARTKRMLAEREWQKVQDYADAKTAVVEEILERARNAARLP
ncbi:MAG: hypothetical protein C5B51_13795 [Terriglobia bacterium]|nr:MAG: hypothetical protein C5B51_13795 [Terriglobia bacterium]